MNPQADLKPTHLSIFALERGTGHPIVGLPCYAEVGVIVIQEPPVEQDPRFKDAIIFALRQKDEACAGDRTCSQQAVTVLLDVFSRLLDKETRDRIIENADELIQLLIEIITAALHIAGSPTLHELDAARLKDVLDQAFRQVAHTRDIPLEQQPVGGQHIQWTHPLGVLATDHVGYLSFDLLRLPEAVYTAVINALRARGNDPEAAIDVSIRLYPLLRDDLQVDVLAQNRFTADAILAKLELDPQAVPDILKNTGLLAMQKPDLTDWRLSPASFAANPRALIGEEGCEQLLPANVALQEFFFYQVVRFNDQQLQAAIPTTVRDKVRLGVVHEYRVAWYALGHSLGQILYSLPLAPGESVNLAVIDWTRRDDAQRSEHTTVDEQLVHNEHRDRTISETVNAAVNEYQHGSSFMGGIAGSVGVSAALSSAVGLAAGLAGSLGGSTASSSGSRDLSATTVQKLSDNITQASSSMRELQSTVVVHSVQAEKEAIETRTIVNYNHSHALTILYYEVLRHFRVVTEFVRLRPAVLVKIPVDWFDGDKAEQNILENRTALEAALLDPKYSAGFDALQRIAHRTQLDKATLPPPGTPPPPAPVPPPYPVPAYPGDRQFIYYTFAMTTGGYFSSGGQHVDIRAGLIGNGLSIRLFNPIRNANDTNDWILNPPGSFRDKDQTNTFVAVNPPPNPTPPVVLWKQVTGMLLDVMPERSDGDPHSQISFKHIKVTARDINGVDTVLIDQSYDDGHLIITESTTVVLPLNQPGPLPPSPTRPADEIEDDAKKAELLAHLAYHKTYYSRAILLKQNATDRALELDAIAFPDGSSVLDHLENRPLELIGDYLAYPCTDPNWRDALLRLLREQEVDAPLNEQLVTLPTRGVFAEARLGHCNASEEIDNTRFWDWQQSPIPHMAPEISPVTPVTPQPQKQDLTPTAFPSSLVNIVNPPAAPDPTGLAAALNVLTTPNIFRDMSGRAEVEDLLKKLSDNTISIAEAANRAREIQNKYGSGSTGGGSGSGSGSGFSTGGSTSSGDGGTRRSTPTPGEQHDQMQVIRNAVDHGNMTPEAGNQTISDMLENAVNKDRQPLNPRDIPLSMVTYCRGAALNYAKRFWNKVCNDGFVALGNAPWFRSVPQGVFEHLNDPANPEQLKDAQGKVAATWTEMDDCTHFLSSCLGKNGGGLPIASEFNGPYGILGAQRLVDYLIKKQYAVFQGEKVTQDLTGKLRPGDIIGYYRLSKGRYTHLALYAGGGDIYCHTYGRAPVPECTWDHRWDIHNGDPDFRWSFISISRPDCAVEV